MPAGAFHQVGETPPPELADRGVGGETPPAARPFRIPVELIPSVRVVREIAGAVRHRGTVRSRIGDEGIAAVVRDIEPLMAIGGPGIRVLHARDQVAMRWTHRRPESEGSVHVNPGARLM